MGSTHLGFFSIRVSEYFYMSSELMHNDLDRAVQTYSPYNLAWMEMSGALSELSAIVKRW